MVKYTRKPTKVGKGLVVWIPKDIADEMEIDEDTLLQVEIEKCELGE